MTELTMLPAGESDLEHHDLYRSNFVHNLGLLLSQTREGVLGCEWNRDKDVVYIRYKDGYTRTVDVEMDSYAAIVRDVMRRI